MKSLETMMGLDPNGYPHDMGYADDPMLQYGMMDDQTAIMEQMGMPPMEDPYTVVGMEPPQGMDEGKQLAHVMLGGPSPQLGQEELNQLAMSLGIGNGNGITLDQMADPMYSPKFDTLKFMGGY